MARMPDIIELGPEDEARRLWSGALEAHKSAADDVVSLCESLDLGLHAAEILVARGATVAAGETIARVGSTDSLKGPSLHFEIREGKEARDPRRWLRRR